MSDEQNQNRVREALQRRWGGKSVVELASRGAAALAHAAGEWDPPIGVKAQRDTISLAIGIPDAGSLPREAFSKAMAQVMARPDDEALRYGMGEGYTRIVEHLASKYSRDNQMEVTSKWFQLSAGSGGGIDTAVRSVIDFGDVVLVEAPTYMGTLRNFTGLGAEVHAVPIDHEGLDIAALARTVRSLKDKGKRVRMLYTIASFHNPSGACLSSERRWQLLDLAAQEGFLILEDEAYRDLYYDEPPPMSLFGMSRGQGVIAVGSFSKILATGLRVGWIHATPELVQLMARMRFDMGQNQPTRYMLGQVLVDGVIEPHLERVRGIYKTKMNALADALERHAGEHLTFSRPGGGFYLWARLGQGLTTEAVWRTAMHEGLSLNPGFRFFPDEASQTGQFVRLAFSWTGPDQLDEGARRLGVACARVAAGDGA
jgi:2-aminoadipate transaminase